MIAPFVFATLAAALWRPGAPAGDPLAVFPDRAAMYLRQRHPLQSRFFLNQYRESSEIRGVMEEFNVAMETIAAWELGLSEREMEGLRDGLRIHSIILGPDAEEPYGTKFGTVIEGLPAERLRDHPAVRAPRTFLGGTTYAVVGDLVLAANDPPLFAEMLDRAQGKATGASFADDRALRRALATVDPGAECFVCSTRAAAAWFGPSVSESARERSGAPEVQAAIRTFLRSVEVFDAVVGVFVDEPGRPGEMRTDVRLLVDPSHPLAPLYAAARQEAAPSSLLGWVPPDARFVASARVDLPALVQALRGLDPAAVPSGDDPAAVAMRGIVGSIARKLSGAKVDDFVAWAGATFGKEGLVFSLRSLPSMMGSKAGDAPFAFVLPLASPQSPSTITARLTKWNASLEETGEGLVTAKIPGFPAVCLAFEAEVVLVGPDAATIAAMRLAKSSGRSIEADPLFLDLFRAGRPRSKLLFVRLEEFIPILRVFAPGLLFSDAMPERFAVGFETNEEAQALRIWLGTAPISYTELFNPDAMAPLSLVAQSESLKVSEEKALGLLLALREAQREFRARRLRDRDGDGIAEYGSLSDLAAASLLPLGLTVGGEVREAEGVGYLFRADLPAETDLSERLWAGYAWPREYGATGVNTFWIQPSGLPRRTVDASLAGPGKGPNSENALLPGLAESAFGVPSVESLLWTPVGR